MKWNTWFVTKIIASFTQRYNAQSDDEGSFITHAKIVRKQLTDVTDK